MAIRKLLIVLLFFMVLHAPLSSAIANCKCEKDYSDNIGKAILDYNMVFIGTMKELEFGRDSDKAIFKVKGIWKGNPSSEIKIDVPLGEDTCNYEFMEGQEYIVFAKKEKKEVKQQAPQSRHYNRYNNRYYSSYDRNREEHVIQVGGCSPSFPVNNNDEYVDFVSKFGKPSTISQQKEQQEEFNKQYQQYDSPYNQYNRRNRQDPYRYLQR